MKSGGSKTKTILSILLAILYILLNIWMFQDIMRRETVVSKNANVLVMGTNATFKPFEYKDGDKIVGFDVDLAEEIAKSMNAELKIEDMSFDGLLPALESGQIDLAIAGMSVTEDRSKNAFFSDSYYVASQQIVVRIDSNIRNKYELVGKTIGVQLGTTGDIMARQIKDTKVVQFPAVPNVLQELVSGRIDAAILDNAPAAQYVTSFPNLKILDLPLSREPYAIAIKKGNQKLLDQVNQVISEMKEDGRMRKILMKHFGTEKGQL